MGDRRRVPLRWERALDRGVVRDSRWSCPPERELRRERESTDDYWFVIDPKHRRQAAGMIVLWREARGGLVLRVRRETTRRAPGAVAALDAIRIDSRAVAARLAPGGFDAVFAGPGPPDDPRLFGPLVRVDVDLTLGETMSLPTRPPDAEVEAWIAEALDGDLLDFLHQTTLAFELESPDDRCTLDRLDDWDARSLLAYRTAYPKSRADGFRVGKWVCSVEERYCPAPSCPCRQVALEVVGRDPERAASEPIGTIRLASPFEEAELVGASAEHEALLAAVLERFQARHPSADRLEERRRMMLVVGALMAERRFGEGLPGGGPRGRRA